MITVIHVDTERTWRGGEGQVFKLAQGLVDYGFESIIAAPVKSALMDKARSAGMRVLPLRSTNEISIVQVLDLLKGARRYNAGLFHVHTSHGLLSSAVVKKIISHRMKVVYSRRTDFHLKTNFLKLSRSKYRRCADRIISVSDGIKRVLVEDGVPEDLVTTIHSGIDLTGFNPSDNGMDIRKEFGISPETVLVGMVAALAHHKDPVNFVRAAEIIGSQEPEVHFILVGAGPMWEDVRKILADSRIGSRFVLPGFRNDIPQLLAAIDIFCMSSREEGLCTSILDAMAMAKPVVATCAGGIPEAVKDEFTGLLVPIQDPQSMASAVMSLIGNPQRRLAMGAAGRRRVEVFFNIKDTVSKTAEIYRELLHAE